MNPTILVVAGGTLAASFVCSLLEAALYSITPAKIEVLRQSGGTAASKLARLRSDVEEPIAAILTINTIAHTLGAAWCGALVGEEFGNAAVGFFAAVFTVLVLALTEIVPKSLGVRYADRLGPLIVWPIQLMIWSVWPIVWIAKRAMARLIGKSGPAGPSEDELLVISGLAAAHGSVRPEEHRWVQNALRLDQVTAGALRTPRTVVESFPADTPIAELASRVDDWVHSRVPVTENGQPDQVIGMVLRREVLDRVLLDSATSMTLRELTRPIHFVPEAMPAHRLLKHFIAERAHMVAVVDEFGGFEGVTTLEDVLECMLGAEIIDEHDEVDNYQNLARESGAERLSGDGPAD
ncbi:CNNM domain-containing protein [Engelhardtia mirabilis]|uniref:Magnesium and cobalt efflux protein CorC n=1 Tax=Engelhardtia mirabilis TaxID=2528011 RepID=A0A518BN03_9BACT|nr:Magnesium and cobalt efflux protein CorC [Planctomycetes bacterium Pla133]QDV02652.1 Magnesium and cobalt efflux protein CorC [Planctomycetes bacterium Pla86]